jgi:hypothetical protein
VLEPKKKIRRASAHEYPAPAAEIRQVFGRT